MFVKAQNSISNSNDSVSFLRHFSFSCSILDFIDDLVGLRCKLNFVVISTLNGQNNLKRKKKKKHEFRRRTSQQLWVDENVCCRKCIWIEMRDRMFILYDAVRHRFLLFFFANPIAKTRQEMMWQRNPPKMLMSWGHWIEEKNRQ